jgi:signal transduction histidine kinase
MLFTPEDRAAAALDRGIERARHDGRILEERVYLRKNGTRLACSSVTTPLGDDAVLGFVTVARDLTAQRDAADALVRATAGMEARVAERTQNLQREVARRTAAHDHVTDLMHRLVASREEERAEVARDLHEQLGSQVSALRLALEQVRDRPSAPQPADETVMHALQLTEALGSKVDFLVWQLRPDLLDELGLAAALTRFARDWSTHHGVRVEVHTPAALAGVSRDAEVTFYRIAQEALNNIAAHAHATQADVSLDVRDGVLELVVRDDGIGFGPTANEGGRGLGLLGMRERASLVGATLDVASAPGGGTRVTLRYPLSPSPESALS